MNEHESILALNWIGNYIRGTGLPGSDRLGTALLTWLGPKLLEHRDSHSYTAVVACLEGWLAGLNQTNQLAFFPPLHPRFHEIVSLLKEAASSATRAELLARDEAAAKESS